MDKKVKKLTLSTETLRHLDPNELKAVEGAATAGGPLCNTATHACSGCAPCA